jgi:hypothetical protein
MKESEFTIYSLAGLSLFPYPTFPNQNRRRGAVYLTSVATLLGILQCAGYLFVNSDKDMFLKVGLEKGINVSLSTMKEYAIPSLCRRQSVVASLEV